MADFPAYGRMVGLLRGLVPARLRSDIPVVPVVRFTGLIGVSSPLRPGVTLAGVARLLDRAFSMRNARAVAFTVNSPGGSAAQSHLIYQRIRALADEKKLPVFAFVEDVAASGGYMIACAADEIICDSSSIVGSIGVIGGTFGFHKLMEKLGVERRIYTSGERKAMLDPFLPENPEDVQRLKAIQREIHDVFIDLVKTRRGARLDSRETALFSGEFWTGQKSRALGLVDIVGDLRSVLRERYGEEVRMPVIAERGFFGRRPPGVLGNAVEPWGGANFAEDLISALEARAIWARYGL